MGSNRKTNIQSYRFWRGRGVPTKIDELEWAYTQNGPLVHVAGHTVDQTLFHHTHGIP